MWSVGIRPAGEDAKGRYRLRSQANGHSRLVDGKRFFSHNGLTATKARHYPAEELGDGIIGFTLAEEPETDAAEAAAPEKGKKTGGRRKARAAA